MGDTTLRNRDERMNYNQCEKRSIDRTTETDCETERRYQGVYFETGVVMN